MPVNDESLVLLENWRQSLGDLLDILGGVPHTRSLDDMRAGYLEMLKQHPLPDGIDVEEVMMGDVSARRVTPVGHHPHRNLIYFHGGAYIFGGSAGYVALAGRLALAVGANVYIPDYRLAPEHPFPAPIEDCLSAYKWLLDSGLNALDIAFAGDSAGGALTISVMTMARDSQLALPACGVAISP
jgi:acetyl esterase/lipase